MNPTHAKRKRPTVLAVTAIDKERKVIAIGEVSREEWIARARQSPLRQAFTAYELAGMWRPG